LIALENTHVLFAILIVIKCFAHSGEVGINGPDPQRHHADFGGNCGIRGNHVEFALIATVPARE